MILKTLRVSTNGFDKTNCYIIHDENTKETMVIDPGGEVEKILELLNILEAKVKYIYLTHCHGDHIAALKPLKQATNAKILIHRDDAEGLYNLDINLAKYIGINLEPIEADARVDDGDILHVGEIELKVIHTPGHTEGGSSLYCEKEKMLFSGDTLFRGTWGRTDLPTSDFIKIMQSISNKLLVLPDDTIVYPGHGAPTKIREEEPIYYNLMPREDE